jgi:CubicO group peptidase (beta-lactamase class C family)/pimeloyl-ACP methyl ester carboxylesterase
MFKSVTAGMLCAMAAMAQVAMPPGMQQVIKVIDQAATDGLKNPNDIGYTLAAVTRDGVAWTKSYGRSDADSTYGIGSGAFTAIMLLQLIKSGAVHFSDPVTKYVPEMSSVRNPYPDAAPVTLLQLAVHTSGLTLEDQSGEGDWEKSLVAALPRASFDFEPGTHATFSEMDDSLLALALSRAAHQPYAEYVKQRILQPMGMTHTELSSLGHRPVLMSTMGDLARLAQFAMLAGPDSVLPRKDLEENYRRLYVTNSIAVPNPNEGFGVGFEGETWTSNHYYFILPIAYGGAGYDVALWFEPRRHAGVILLHKGPPGSAIGQMIHSYVYTLNAQKNDAGKQEPARPFPYTEEEVSFDTKAVGIKLAGTLTLPKGTGPFPAVVLMPRLGPLDRDERMLNHRPFLVLADALTRAGIAVLRTDVRGVGKSGGKFAGMQAEDFASDAEVAVAYLKSRPEVDVRKIGLVSHGDGGLAAPIAANRDRDVAFLVMLGAPAVPNIENAVESVRLTAVGNGELPRRAEEQAAAQRKRLSTLKANDPAAELKKLACPVLALYGEKDLSTPAELNVPAMRSTNPNVTVEEVPDVNMLFQTADVGIGRETNWTEETMAPVVMKRIADWVMGR